MPNPFIDAKGAKHDWRTELRAAIINRQKPDGSFVNDKDRAYGESNPELCTAFALLALSYTK